MNKEINTTQFITPLYGKPIVGFCIDYNGTTWVNVNILASPSTILNAAFDGVPFTTIESEQFVCAEWAQIELNQACRDNTRALRKVNKFFEVIEREKVKVLEAYHGTH